MLKKHSLLRYFASLLSFVFGFSATVAAQYGVMETTYKLNGNINELLSNIPIEGIKVSMKSKENHKTTTQSDSLGHFEFEMYRWEIDNTYYFTAEDIDGGAGGGDYLPKDTSVRLNYRDFILAEPLGHWHIERNCRYKVDLKLQKAVVITDTVDPPAKPPLDSSNFNPKPILLPKDTLLTSTPEIAEEVGTLIEVYPNPTNGKVEIVMNSAKGEDISLQLYDDAFKVLLVRSEYLVAGNNQFTLDLNTFASGNYLLVVIRRDKKIVKKIIKL